MSDASHLMYCPSCGEKVETILMVDADGESRHCFVCGARLDQAAAAPFKALEMMMVAEDSMVFREVLKDKIMELGIARQMELTENGEHFIEVFTNRLARGRPISLAVLDIRMPKMNGVNAAMAMRAIERGLKAERPAPILFFSSVRCDDTLKEVLKHCSPARYINKGAGGSPEELADRLAEVIRRLLDESAKS